MKIEKKLLLLNSVAIIGFILTGAYSLITTKKIANKFEGVDQSFRSAITSAADMSGYTKRAEGHMMLYLTLDEEIDKEKAVSRNQSIQEQIEILENNISNQKSEKVLAEAKATHQQFLAAEQDLLTAYQESQNSGQEFEPKNYRDLINRFHNLANELEEKGVLLSQLETDFLDKQRVIFAANKLRGYAKRAESHLMLYLMFGNPEDKNQFFTITDFIREQVTFLDSQVNDPQSRDFLEIAKQKIEPFRNKGQEIINIYENAIARGETFDFDDQEEKVQEFYQLASGLRKDGVNIATRLTDLQFQKGEIVSQEVASLQQNLILVILVGTILTLGLTYWQARNISQPLKQLQNAARKIAHGDFDTQIETTSEDEIGQLAFAFNQMSQKVQELIRETEIANQEKLSSQAETIELHKTDNESLQLELLQFISSVEEASNGNLTVRANITDGSIGIVADFFNSIIESLRDIIAQVKVTSTQVNSSISGNEKAIEEVAQETLQQTEQISQALSQVAEMTQSIQQVANNAQQAAVVSRTASVTAETGGKDIEETVESILTLRETIAGTAKKVKRLGESSQEISKVVSLINQIAMQTNLLAINASIEASRAGEEGRGFAVVAEEVGELATKSAEATQEIEEIVENIQEETQEVVAAMEIGTSQVVEGTRLVQNTKNSLNKIAEVSRQIDVLLQSISSATISQAETSQTVTELMKGVAIVSQRTSNASLNVSESLEETVKIARNLETSVDTFIV